MDMIHMQGMFFFFFVSRIFCLRFRYSTLSLIYWQYLGVHPKVSRLGEVMVWLGVKKYATSSYGVVVLKWFLNTSFCIQFGIRAFLWCFVLRFTWIDCALWEDSPYIFHTLLDFASRQNLGFVVPTGWKLPKQEPVPGFSVDSFTGFPPTPRGKKKRFDVFSGCTQQPDATYTWNLFVLYSWGFNPQKRRPSPITK